jgi:RNA polymerase sigma-70 factor (sigma-E family)
MGETGSIVDEAEGVDTAPTGTGPATVPSAEPDTATRPTVVLAGGPPGTFGDFYANHYAGLVRLAALLSGSVDTAPDLVQDCFVRLHGRWTSVREPLPYIRRSVVHACASHHRRTAVVRRNPPPEPRVAELGADELEDALAALPARQRAAVVLRYYGDLPDAAIARALRCREGTVRSLISRALADLRKVIEP